MMTMMMTTNFSEIKKNSEEIRVSKFGGMGKKYGFLAMAVSSLN